jgi:hypothetical protein
MAQLVQGSVPKQLSNRSTYHAPSSVQRGDIESGVPKRRTIGLGDAKRSTTRGRVIAVSRRSSSVPEQPKPRVRSQHRTIKNLCALARLGLMVVVVVHWALQVVGSCISYGMCARRVDCVAKRHLTGS